MTTQDELITAFGILHRQYLDCCLKCGFITQEVYDKALNGFAEILKPRKFVDPRKP